MPSTPRRAATAVVAALALLAAPELTLPAHAAPGPVLKACYNLRATTENDRLVNGPFSLVVHSEGLDLEQMVMMNGDRGPQNYLTTTWSRDNPTPPWTSTDRTYLALYCNGDLALRRAGGTLLWHSNTGGRGIVRLALTSGGNLVLQNATGATVWQAGTGRAAIAANSILPSNQKLTTDAFVAGYGEHHSLSMQTDGNLVYRANSTVKWQSNTHGKGAYARLTTKAQLQVVAPGGTLLWSSRPTGTTYSVLDVKTIYQWWPTEKLVWGPGL
ncbi:hypothetical protein [Terrabacter sp. BE26]|uniref:hypothetical protein n=1 Tax=Terrabacter sp. BE26 TaxID=2898152 RepID=UPI0035BE3125